MSDCKPITCRAALLVAPNEPHSIEQVIIDAPQGDQVRIRMVSAGICGSDLHIVEGNMKPNGSPIVLGHEGAGVVEAVGPDVSPDIRVGDHVLTNLMSQCGKCETCQNLSHTNHCETQGMTAMGAIPNKRRQSDDAPVYGFCGLGIFSEYALLRQSQVIKIDKSAKLQNACLISCAVTTGYYAARNQANVTAGSTVAVFGLGAIGLNAVFGAKCAGAKRIIGIDINAEKMVIGKQFGCTDFVDSTTIGDQNTLEQYLLDRYSPIEFAIECTGAQQCVDAAFRSLCSYGTLALVGVSAKTVLNFPLLGVLMGRRIVGGLLGAKRSSESFSELAKLYAEGQYPIDRLISGRYSLHEIDEAFQALRDRKSIRSLIVF